MANGWAAWWNKKRQSDAQYLTVKGTCPSCGTACSANLFANTYKQPGEKSPDFKEPGQKPAGKPPVNSSSSAPAKAATRLADDDIPF